ncbi:MAG TPA: sigma-54-dependent Fis family transcriptional regulator [Rhodoferax sp.]|nr:sigma-54-dependent Fis family transcriptional regulator [Rhodoferax sp.]
MTPKTTLGKNTRSPELRVAPSIAPSPKLPQGSEVVFKATNAEVDKVRFPNLLDLMGRLHFSTRDGRIWLDDQRMLLVHAKALGALRRELIEHVGTDAARGFMTRMGYCAGVCDAQLARKVRIKASLNDMFVVGPQMHCLEGIGLSEVVRLDIDIERGIHYGEFLWTSSIEDEEHMRHFVVDTEPACWMQTGYASGYSTEFMGRQVLYREVECQSMGQMSCRIVGKLVEDWDEEARKDMRFLVPQAVVSGAVTLARQPSPTARPAAGEPDLDSPVGISPGFNAVLHLLKKVAPTQATVLFLGESGVGKEVFARMLHRRSSRHAKPFVALNCAAIPENLIESELFGVERGAFTGASQSRLGRFERADGGTLFLDEIGTLSFGAQSKLLRVLQEGEVERVGDSSTRKINVRVIAATNVDLREEVKAGNFREDLFFRLNVFPIRILPLRERREDIPLLMAHFLAKFNHRHERHLTGFTQRAVDAMLSYDWPGNVRELENIIERGVILASDDNAIDASQLFSCGEQFSDQRYAINSEGKLVSVNPASFTVAPAEQGELDRVTRRVNDLLIGGRDQSPDNVSLDEIETMLLRRAIDAAQGNVAAAARSLGITRPQMLYRLKSRGILQESD